MWTITTCLVAWWHCMLESNVEELKKIYYTLHFTATQLTVVSILALRTTPKNGPIQQVEDAQTTTYLLHFPYKETS